MRPPNRLCLVIVVAATCGIAANCYSSDAAKAGRQESVPAILDLPLGKASLHDALLHLGSPKALYLAGEDGESPQPKASDPLVLRYERSFELAKPHPASILLFFAPETYRLQVATVTFEDTEKSEPVAISKDEIEKVYGTKYRLAHRRMIIDSDQIEGRLSDCDDPEGKVENLIFPGRGLEVFLEQRGEGSMVIELRFSEGILSGKESLAPCSKKGTSEGASRSSHRDSNFKFIAMRMVPATHRQGRCACVSAPSAPGIPSSLLGPSVPVSLWNS